MRIGFSFLVCLFVLSFSKYKSQVFGLNLHHNYFYSVALQYPMDSNYRVFVWDHSYRVKPTKSPSIKIYNFKHQLVKTIALPRGMASPYEGPPLKDGNKLLWPCAYWDTTTLVNPIYQMGVLELDTMYNPIKMHKIGPKTDSNSIYGPTGIVSLPNGYVIGGFKSHPTSNSGSATKLYRLDKNFSVLDSTEILSQLSIENNTSYNYQIMALTDRLSTPCMLSSIKQKIILDTNLAIINCQVMDSLGFDSCKNNGTTFSNKKTITHHGWGFALSKTKTFVLGEYLYSCRLTPPNSDEVIVNAVFSGSTVVKSNFLWNPSEKTNYPVQWNTNYAVKLPYIISVAAVGFTFQPNFPPPFFPYFSMQKSKLFVTKTDTMGNIIWSKSYGGNMNYFGRGVAFTFDGGCVIAGTRYDSTSMYATHVSENFLLKIDPSGNFVDVSIFKADGKIVSPIKCFPNPADNTVHFDVPFEEDMCIEVYNQLGQKVLEKREYKNADPIDLNQLPNNLYYYTIKTKTNSYSGKFLKE